MQCVGNLQANCGGGTIVSAGAGGRVTSRSARCCTAMVMRNNDWWSYNGYIQTRSGRGKLRLNGGLRYDWQQSKHPRLVVAPNICVRTSSGTVRRRDHTDSITGKSIKPFANFAPRLSATYDLFGNGKTSVHASFSYYYDDEDHPGQFALERCSTVTTLTWGDNQSSGACSTTAGAPCWNDANRDSLVQINELIGTPISSNARFVRRACLAVGQQRRSESTKLGRTREVVAGVQHELISNLAVAWTTSTGSTTTARAATRRATSRDRARTSRRSTRVSDLHGSDQRPDRAVLLHPVDHGVPTGLSTIVATDTAYRSYHGVDLTLTKRFSNKWQANVSATIQRQPQWFPAYTFTDPQNVGVRRRPHDHDANANARYLGQDPGVLPAAVEHHDVRRT
jgi:hypothetical protein